VKKLLRRRVLIPAVLLGAILFLFYGPFVSFRLILINTSMHSSRFQFVARMLYTENYINRVIGRVEPHENPRTDDSALMHAWDDGIFFAEIRGDHFRGYLIRVNDPRRFSFPQASVPEGSLLEQLVADNMAIGGISASGYAYSDRRGIVWGTTIVDGQFISRCSKSEYHVMGGFNRDYKLIVGGFTEEEMLTRQFQWAFEFFPLLIVNGEKINFQPHSGGYAPRTAIGQTAEGHVLLLVVDGRQRTSIGAIFSDLQTILYANGAINAINLDGGSTSSMVFRGGLINSPSDGDEERLLPNAIVFR